MNQRALFGGAICVFLWLFVSFTCYAVDATWIYEYSVPDNFVRFNDVISVSNGGYLGVGEVWDVETGDTAQNAFMSRIDQNGQVLWSRNFTFPGRWYDELHSVVESSDGGFIATGKVLLDGTTEHGTPSLISAVLILKVNSGGAVLWQKLLRNYSNNSSYGARIKGTVDGNYVIVGQKTAYQFNEQWDVYSYVTGGALITKIDGNGQVLFSRSYYGDWTHSWSWSFNDVTQDADGSYYAIGYAGVEGYSEGIGWGGMLLVKMDSDGDLVWAKKLDYAIDGEAQYVSDYGQRILFLDNALYVTGITGNTFTLGKYSLTGVRLWTKLYACNRSYDTSIGGTSALISSGDGNLFILTNGACKTIAKINSQGSVLWTKRTVDHILSGTPASMTLEADKGLVVGGWGTGTIATATKYDSNGTTCEEESEIAYSVTEIEMVSNVVPHYVATWMNPSEEELPTFSGPNLTFEKYCGMPAPSALTPEIKANGQKGSVVALPGEPVSITISLDSGNKTGQKADWWIGVVTSFAPPLNWLTYVYPAGWQLGLQPCLQAPIVQIPSFEVFNMALPVGAYTFFFALDEADGAAAGPWFGLDVVDVTVK